MNSFLNICCLLAVVGVTYGNPVGIGGLGYGASVIASPVTSYYAPAAVSTASLIKAAPIPVIRPAVVPVVSAPIIQRVAAPIATYTSLSPVSSIASLSPLGVGLGHGGLGAYGVRGLSLASPIATYGIGGIGGIGYGGKYIG